MNGTFRLWHFSIDGTSVHSTLPSPKRDCDIKSAKCCDEIMETFQQIQIQWCYLNVLSVVTEDCQHL